MWHQLLRKSPFEHPLAQHGRIRFLPLLSFLFLSIGLKCEKEKNIICKYEKGIDMIITNAYKQ